jgi:hypothetical protein
VLPRGAAWEVLPTRHYRLLKGQVSESPPPACDASQACARPVQDARRKDAVVIAVGVKRHIPNHQRSNKREHPERDAQGRRASRPVVRVGSCIPPARLLRCCLGGWRLDRDPLDTIPPPTPVGRVLRRRRRQLGHPCAPPRSICSRPPGTRQLRNRIVPGSRCGVVKPASPGEGPHPPNRGEPSPLARGRRKYTHLHTFRPDYYYPASCLACRVSPEQNSSEHSSAWAGLSSFSEARMSSYGILSEAAGSLFLCTPPRSSAQG